MDIKRLYTQVPLNEVSEDILKTIYDKNTILVLKKKKLRKVLKLCSQNVFLYDDKVNRQTTVVAMDNPLAPGL